MGAVVVLLAIVFFVGVIRGQASLIMLVSLLLATTVGLRLWSRRSAVGLTYARSFDPPRIFPGEQTTYVVEMKNQKGLPLPWIHLDEHLPTAIVPVTEMRPAVDPAPGAAGPRDRRRAHVWGEEGWQRRRAVS